MKNKAAQELGRLGGIVKSDKKAKSSRENGKRGGRPKKDKIYFQGKIDSLNEFKLLLLGKSDKKQLLKAIANITANYEKIINE